MSTNALPLETSTTVKPYKYGAFEQYVSFSALGGLISSDDGQLSRMTVSQFCQQFGIDRKTTYRWRQTSGFADKVRTRRYEIFPLARESACWNQLYLIALRSPDHNAAVDACKTLLGHFSGLQLPAKRQAEPKHSGASWAELLKSAQAEGIIDPTATT